jgi:hypothetical protein
MPKPNIAGLKPDVQSALDELEQRMKELGKRVQVNSAYRSEEDQARLYANRARNPYPVAKPGKSRHQQGTAIDMKVPGMTQEEFAAYAQGAGFNWAGDKDRIHFDYKGGGSAPASSSYKGPDLSSIGRLISGGAQAAPASSGGYKGPDLSSIGQLIAPKEDNALHPVFPPAPEQKPMNWWQGMGNQITTAPQRAAKYVGNWWNMAAHSKDEQGNTVPFVDRLQSSVFGPAMGLADLTAGGGAIANALSPGNPQGGFIKRGVMPVLNAAGAGLGEAGNQLVGNIGDLATSTANSIYGPEGQNNAQFRGFDLGKILNAGKAGLMGKANGMNFVSRALEAAPPLDTNGNTNWLAMSANQLMHDPAYSHWLDLGAGLELMPKAMRPIEPAFKLTGALGKYAKTVGADILVGVSKGKIAIDPNLSMIDRAGYGLDRAAQALSPRAPGVPDTSYLDRYRSIGGGKAAGAIATGYKRLTDATPEYRQAQEEMRQRMQVHSDAKQRAIRIDNLADNLTKKLKASGVQTHGNFMEGTPEAARFESGPLVDQAAQHYAEAGSVGAFFTHPDAVLVRAVRMGLPPDRIAEIGNELKSLGQRGGEEMVKSGLMDDKTFQANRGYWVPRLYRTNWGDPLAVNKVISDMVDAGIDTTKANGVAYGLQKVGMSGPPEVKGLGLKAASAKSTLHERTQLTPEGRADLLPDYNNLPAVLNRMVHQYKASAIHQAMDDYASDPSLSVAHKILNYGADNPLKWRDTPRIKGMRDALNIKIKQSQDQLSRGLETAFNQQHKWVSVQEVTAGKKMQEVVEHQAKRPVMPSSPNVPPEEPLAPAALVSGKKGVTRPGEGTVEHNVNTGVPIKVPDLAAALKKGMRKGGKIEGIAYEGSLGRVERLPSSPTDTSASFNKVDLGKAVENAKRIEAKAAAVKSSAKFVKDLARWQKEDAAWTKKNTRLSEDMAAHQAELTKRQAILDRTTAAVDQWFAEAEKMQRRKDLLEGGIPTDEHANDALSGAEERMKFQITDPAERQQWYDAWKREWQSHNIDIFGEEAPVTAKAPNGVPQGFIDAVDQNISPAIALDNALSSPVEKPGYSLWQTPEGAQPRYGAMEGRYGPEVLRQFVEDVIDPARYAKTGDRLFGWIKTLAALSRELKLRYNPALNARIMSTRLWESRSTVKAAGYKWDIAAYSRGMKEYKAWSEGAGPETKAVKAMLQGVEESGAGYATSENPDDRQIARGGEGKLQQFRAARRERFVDIHQIPKAGLANVLVEQGVAPATAGRIADVGLGTRGGVGGIETHGVMQIVEGLNRYGLAMFTSYPLHSINRFFHLMVTRPEVLMEYPVLRNYLMQNAGAAAQGRDEREEVKPNMIPIPGIKNDRGDPVWLDARMLMPFGGAYENAFFDKKEGVKLAGFPQIFNQLSNRAELMGKTGVNPTDLGMSNWGNLANQFAPPIIQQSQQLYNSIIGKPNNARQLEPETPLMGLLGIGGINAQFPQNSVDRELWGSKTMLPERESFMQTYVTHLTEGSAKPKDYSGYTENWDLNKAQNALAESRRYLGQLTHDKSINEYEAKQMIRRQIDWIVSITKVVNQQQGMAARQLQEEQDYGTQEYSEPIYSQDSGDQGQGLPGQAF